MSKLSPERWEWAYGKGATLLEDGRALLHVPPGAAWNLTEGQARAISKVPEMLAMLRGLLAEIAVARRDASISGAADFPLDGRLEREGWILLARIDGKG